MKKTIALSVLIILSAVSFAGRPRIAFFSELPGNEFSRLFSDTMLIRQLSEMNAGVRIGLIDLTPERAATIMQLNRAGIPVTAWLLLDSDEGYWFSAFNAEKASARYDDFMKWTKEYGLEWKGVGIDLELDMNDIKLGLEHPLKLVFRMYGRLFDRKTIPAARESYSRLIARIKRDGFSVESYIIPFILEERFKKAEGLQRLTGIVDIETDTEIPMLYTSAMKNGALIPLYHIKGMPIALGSTGGGVKIGDFELASLTWEELERDIKVASGLTDEIVIFCLESSAAKGFLPKIAAIDFDAPVPDVSEGTKKVERMKSITKAFVTVLDHPYILTAAILAIISLIVFAAIKTVKFISKKISR